MPRRLLRRLLPHPHTVRDHPSLRVLGHMLGDPNLWHLNRRSVSAAAFVGVFVAFVPLPVQMLIAAAAAIALRCNITLAVALVWITNPVTMPPIFYLAYRVGALLLGAPHGGAVFELSWQWMLQHLEPFLLGCFVCGLCFGTLAFFSMRLVWNLGVMLKWRRRVNRRQSGG